MQINCARKVKSLWLPQGRDGYREYRRVSIVLVGEPGVYRPGEDHRTTTRRTTAYLQLSHKTSENRRNQKNMMAA